MRNLARNALVGAGALALIGVGAGVSIAATSSPPVIHACVSTRTHAITERTGTRCPSGTRGLSWNQRGVTGATGAQGATGATGAAGPAGPAGAEGPAGPSGVVSTSTTDLGAVASVPTGGGFVANSTEVGTVQLGAGTYLINLNAKATPRASGDTAQIFPSFFVYNQAKNSNFTGDLFNVGSGALEPDGTNHDSYFSGSSVITVPAGGETIYVYAFGYDSDTGAGAYALDDLSVTATQINPGS